jgi:hypothetical protein
VKAEPQAGRLHLCMPLMLVKRLGRSIPWHSVFGQHLAPGQRLSALYGMPMSCCLVLSGFREPHAAPERDLPGGGGGESSAAFCVEGEGEGGA